MQQYPRVLIRRHQWCGRRRCVESVTLLCSMRTPATTTNSSRRANVLGRQSGFIDCAPHCYSARLQRFRTHFLRFLVWPLLSCLDEWRKVNRGRRKAYSCEICKQPYRIISHKPGFMSYMMNCWTPSEKLIYGSALVSLVFTIVGVRTIQAAWNTLTAIVGCAGV